MDTPIPAGAPLPIYAADDAPLFRAWATCASHLRAMDGAPTDEALDKHFVAFDAARTTIAETPFASLRGLAVKLRIALEAVTDDRATCREKLLAGGLPDLSDRWEITEVHVWHMLKQVEAMLSAVTPAPDPDTRLAEMLSEMEGLNRRWVGREDSSDKQGRKISKQIEALGERMHKLPSTSAAGIACKLRAIEVLYVLDDFEGADLIRSAMKDARSMIDGADALAAAAAKLAAEEVVS